MRRCMVILLCTICLMGTVRAAPRGESAAVSCEAMNLALKLEQRAQKRGCALSWIQILALAASRSEACPDAGAIRQAYRTLLENPDLRMLPERAYRRYQRYETSYRAVLEPLVKRGPAAERAAYEGRNAFFPIAAGYWYLHGDNLQQAQTTCRAQARLQHTILSAAGTPVVAAETGCIAALEQRHDGGWRLGICSEDRKRYYEYAPLQRNAACLRTLALGDRVEAGQVIGFMTGPRTQAHAGAAALKFGFWAGPSAQQAGGRQNLVEAGTIARFLEAQRSEVLYDAREDRWKCLPSLENPEKE